MLSRLLLAFIVGLALSTSLVYAVSVEDGRSELGDAFVALSRAESAGGDVGTLVLKLNTAAALIDKGGEANLVAADKIIRDVTGQASGVEVAGAQRILYRYIAVSVTLVVLTAAALIIWFRGSRIFFLAWLRFRRGWRVDRV